MKITLEALKTLEAIERCGSFALAAEGLFRVPSALTYTINTLESQLNSKIFDRAGHRAKLTPVGKLVLIEGKKLLFNAELLEKKVKMHQSGWEEQITLAYDQAIPFKNLLFLIEAFYQECPGVNLKWSGEVLGGCWDALLSNRATLSIGVSGEPPHREDISMLNLGQIEFVFLVGAKHPLAHMPNRISNEVIVQNRIIAVADTSRGFSPLTSGLLPNQNVLTVSTFQEKIEAMVAGLGVGYLPLSIAQEYIDSGEMVVKEVHKLKSKATLSTAWRPSMVGKGLQWFIDKLVDKQLCKRIMNPNNQL